MENVAEIKKALADGSQNRRVGATCMNKESSRSLAQASHDYIIPSLPHPLGPSCASLLKILSS